MRSKIWRCLLFETNELAADLAVGYVLIKTTTIITCDVLVKQYTKQYTNTQTRYQKINTLKPVTFRPRFR